MSDKTCSQEFVEACKPKAPTKNINKLCAFTLAEVLITLAIIGVVAALTIPMVVKNYQKQQTVTKLKKTYTNLNQALLLSRLENGDFKNWDMTQRKGKEYYEKYLKGYLKVNKVLGYYDWANTPKLKYKFPNGTKDTYRLGDAYWVNLADGQTIAIAPYNDHTNFWIDINGPDIGPNIHMRDVFLLNISKNGNYEGKLFAPNDNKTESICKKKT